MILQKWTGGAGRPSAALRGYGHKWRVYRAQYLEEHPYCVGCGANATVVDHKRPHRGKKSVFWDPKNHQAMCASCHSKKTRIGKIKPPEPLVVKPSKNPHWKTLHQIADAAVSRLSDVYLEAWRAASQRLTASDVIAATAQGQAAVIGLLSDAWDTSVPKLQADAGVIINEIFQHAGQASVSTVPASARVRKADPQVSATLVFDGLNPESLQWVQRYVGRKIVEIDVNTMNGINVLVGRAFKEGIPPRQLARLIRPSIGLTTRQSAALMNVYHTLSLKEAVGLGFDDIPSDIVARLRRDRLLGLARAGKFEAVLDRLRDKMIRRRALVIARTETIDAAVGGQAALWRQAVQARRIDPKKMEVKWILTPDDRTCPTCKEQAASAGRRPIDGVYPNGVTGPTRHPQCRCAEGLVPATEATTAATAPLADRFRQAFGDGSEASVRAAGAILRKEIEQTTVGLEPLANIKAMKGRLYDQKAELLAKMERVSDVNEMAALNKQVGQIYDQLGALLRSQRNRQDELLSNRRVAIVKALKQLRPMGGTFKTTSRSPGVKLVQQQASHLPTDWIDRSNDAQLKVRLARGQRARYRPQDGTVQTDGTASTTLHELGHRMEHAHKDLRAAQFDFWRRRTKDDVREQLRAVTGNRGYQSSEVTYKDHFTNAYMGKTYGRRDEVAQFYEVLTMGLEGVYYGKYKLWEKDTDMVDFILGVLGGK